MGAKPIPYEEVGHLHKGGIAHLKIAVLDDGTKVVLRELLPTNLFKWRLRQGFIRGTQIREQLSPHPNIIDSLERGREGVVPYEIIEYLDGVHLRCFMQQQQKCVAEHCIEILRQAAAALAHVHRKGFIHLDVKPENFVVVHVDEKFIVKLTDFDLTVQAKERRMKKQAGTVAYMAPEQIRKDIVGPSADIFAFGIVAYQLVTKHMPFVGNSGKKALWAQTHDAYRIKRPVEWNPELTAKLDRVIMKCLEKHPEDRFPSMAYLCQELAHY